VTSEAYRFESLRKDHNRVDFSCGVEALDRYFHKQASLDFRRNLCVPYVLLETATGPVVGYYTLSTFSVVPQSLPEKLTGKLPGYPAFPAILVGRFAVDLRFRGQGFGEMLLVDALRRCLEISQQVGALAVVVDAKDDAACTFYEHYGFVHFVDHKYPLFLPIGTISHLNLR
jgi:GNAT superfamily N-acetyltransferase